jgi:nitrile hydratase subunit beta
MDTIADLGGAQGWGSVPDRPADEVPFKEPWEGRAFALTLLSMGRISGQNLDAFRAALGRLHPTDYLVDGYYGRWLHAAEAMLVESGIIDADAVTARVRALNGEAVDEPAVPEHHKPDYAPTAGGSLRTVEAPPAFAVGDRVRTKDLHPRGPTKLPAYVRRRTGTVRIVQPAHVLPDTNAVFQGENAQYVYAVSFDSRELWGPDAEPFDLYIDLFESYLEKAEG